MSLIQAFFLRGIEVTPGCFLTKQLVDLYLRTNTSKSANIKAVFS